LFDLIANLIKGNAIVFVDADEIKLLGVGCKQQSGSDGV